jgi:hypothetical protein
MAEEGKKIKVFAEAWSAANESVLYGVNHDENYLAAISAAKLQLEQVLLTGALFDAQAMAEAKAKGVLPVGNIVGVGIAEKETKGRPTGQLAIKIYVEKKNDGTFTISSEADIPPTFSGFKTDVVEIGLIEAFHETAESLAEALVDRQSYPRPVPCGVSVGHPRVTAGTAGCLVYDDQAVYILSNNHVLANVNNAKIGEPIIQPGVVDGGQVPRDQIGQLVDFVPLQMNGPPNSVDCALAWVTLQNARPEIIQIGLPNLTIMEPQRGMAVMKRGRTTGLTTNGIIEDINLTIRVSYRDAGWAIFNDQILIRGQGFSSGGDSGALIVERTNNNPVGLLFSGNDVNGTTVANRISKVLETLRVSIY